MKRINPLFGSSFTDKVVHPHDTEDNSSDTRTSQAPPPHRKAKATKRQPAPQGLASRRCFTHRRHKSADFVSASSGDGRRRCNTITENVEKLSFSLAPRRNVSKESAAERLSPASTSSARSTLPLPMSSEFHHAPSSRFYTQAALIDALSPCPSQLEALFPDDEVSQLKARLAYSLRQLEISDMLLRDADRAKEETMQAVMHQRHKEAREGLWETNRMLMQQDDIIRQQSDRIGLLEGMLVEKADMGRTFEGVSTSMLV